MTERSYFCVVDKGISAHTCTHQWDSIGLHHNIYLVTISIKEAIVYGIEEKVGRIGSSIADCNRGRRGSSGEASAVDHNARNSLVECFELNGPSAGIAAVIGSCSLDLD